MIENPDKGNKSDPGSQAASNLRMNSLMNTSPEVMEAPPEIQHPRVVAPAAQSDPLPHKGEPRPSGAYSKLLGDAGFESVLWTQFLAAFNDNFYKMIVQVTAVAIAAGEGGSVKYLALANAVFVLPFLLFAGPAGQIADRFSKTRVLQFTKLFEIPVMIFGIFALMAHRIDMLLVVLFCLAAQANFFSPAKYGILPEIMGEENLARANGLIELSTFAAIVLGTGAGALLFAHWKNTPLYMGITLLAIAIVGSLTSLGISKAPPAGSTVPFRWNPFHEVWIGIGSLRSNRSMLLTVGGISYFWFIGALLQNAVLAFRVETLHADDETAGYLVCALAIGIGVGSVIAGRLSGDRIELGIVGVGSVLMGLFAFAIGMTSSVPWALVWLTGLGLSGGLFIVPLNAYLQDRADPKEKGRILTTNNFINMVGVILASGVLSLLHDVVGLSAARLMMVLGVFTLVGTIGSIVLMPAISLRFFLLTILHAFFKIRYFGAENLPKEGGALIACNHTSYADPVLVGGATSRFMRFLMFQPYFDIPYLKPFFQTLRAIPLSQSNPREALRTIRSTREEILKGRMVCIFPEGAVTRIGNMITFQRGVERLMGPEVPIIPAYIDGMWGHPLSTKGGGLFKSWSRVLRPVVTVYYGEPIKGQISAADLRLRVMELASRAMELRKTPEYNLARRFTDAARKNWSKPALADSTGKDITFGKALAAGMAIERWIDAECPAQQCIGILLPACVGGALANIGLALSGRVAVNLNFTAGQEQVNSAVKRCEINTVFTSAAFLEKVKIGFVAGVRIVMIEEVLKGAGAMDLLRARWGSLRHNPSPGDPACIIFSSGSTGEPKGVELSHGALMANVDAVAQVYEVGPGDCMLGSLPFFHAFGYTMTLWLSMIQGFRAVYHTNPIEAQAIGELSEKYQATFLLSTPTFCMAYLRKCQPEQFKHLRYVLTGAEKMRPELAQSFEKKFGIAPLEGYGATEMGPVISVNRPDIPNETPPQEGNRVGSVGRPLPGIAVKVVDPETLEPKAVGEEGHLLVKGPSQLTGYWKDPKRTADAIRDGYYMTGDIARIDDDGFVYITGRISRFSKIGGEMVPHLRIEEAIGLDGGCVVIGVPDAQRGERLAVLYTSADTEPAAMIDRLRTAGLPALWIPKRENFYRVENIPTLGTGKTDLRAVRQLAIELAEKPEKPAGKEA
jgi:acyl-[acyl-carrier-protein]-phospholipid O-acyltransferase/long-chain-fatty-acid--[acyl-carrier-protein] ligase